MNGMSGSSTAAPAPSPSGLFQHRGRHHGGMMHMTFFWGKNTEVLFDGWPGTSLKMYWVCLATVFVFSALSEWLSRCGIMKAGPASLGGGLAQTVIYTVRAGLSYLIMLAVMSFNGGVFLAAMAGFGVGFLIFGSRSFKDTGINNNHTESGGKGTSAEVPAITSSNPGHGGYLHGLPPALQTTSRNQGPLSGRLKIL
ncbi:hypothetical protein Bca101_047850 [Brassica carinata]